MAKRLPLIILLWLIADLYFFQAVKTIFPSSPLLGIYWIIDVAIIAGIFITTSLRAKPALMQTAITWVMGFFLLTFVPRLFSAPVLLIEDAIRIFRGFPPRQLWVSELTLAIAAAIFFFVLFGITQGRHFYRVRKTILHFTDLPPAFDGFTITQITDVHSGSFSSAAGVQKGLDLVNAQRSDLIVFTGDLVNTQAAEMEKWIPAFAKLSAPMGKYSILGNHDYGDYMRWESVKAKTDNFLRLKAIHAEIGFRLLLDEAVTLHKGADSIALIGVENWGTGGFQKYGDLSKAMSSVSESAFKILLSHDPSHWEAVTLKQRQKIHLTLSGHTHGMQFGIDWLGFKWSPVKYVYKQWLGLYEQAGRYLYVNRGFGFIGLKGRIGMWPEVAVITLKRSSK